MFQKLPSVSICLETNTVIQTQNYSLKSLWNYLTVVKQKSVTVNQFQLE